PNFVGGLPGPTKLGVLWNGLLLKGRQAQFCGWFTGPHEIGRLMERVATEEAASPILWVVYRAPRNWASYGTGRQPQFFLRAASAAMRRLMFHCCAMDRMVFVTQ